MKKFFSPKNNPRVIIIQKLYGKFFNKDEAVLYAKNNKLDFEVLTEERKG